MTNLLIKQKRCQGRLSFSMIMAAAFSQAYNENREQREEGRDLKNNLARKQTH